MNTGTLARLPEARDTSDQMDGAPACLGAQEEEGPDEAANFSGANRETLIAEIARSIPESPVSWVAITIRANKI
jgi:hypothetical protein